MFTVLDLSGRFAGQPVEQSGMVRRNQGWQVNVAADHSGSKPEAHKRRGKWGYHPLEELTKHEREAMLAGNGRPSDADIARTITEVTRRSSSYGYHLILAQLQRSNL